MKAATARMRKKRRRRDGRPRHSLDSSVNLFSFHQRFRLRLRLPGIVPRLQLGRDQQLVVSCCCAQFMTAGIFAATILVLRAMYEILMGNLCRLILNSVRTAETTGPPVQPEAAMVVMAVMTALGTVGVRFTYDSWLPYTRSADRNGFAIWCFYSLTLLNR